MTTKGPSRLDHIESIALRRPGITRAEIADRLQMSTSAVTTAVSRLIQQGRLSEHEPDQPSGQRGRPRTRLRTTGAATVGVLLWSGGTFTRSIVGYDGTIHDVVGHDVPLKLATEDIVHAARKVLEPSPGWERPEAIVFGIPSPFHHGVGVPTPPQPNSSDQRSFANVFVDDPFDALQAVIDVPLVVENDANLAALGETAVLPTPAHSTLYFTIHGDGVGSGLCIDGRIVAGGHGLGAEIAHLRMGDEAQDICSCGARGCLDTGTGARLTRQLAATFDRDMTWPDFIAHIDAGSPGPIRVMQDLGRQVARTVANVCIFLDPSLIIVEAGSSTSTQAFREGFSDHLTQATPPFISSVLTIDAGRLGPKAELFGALEVARQNAKS